MWPQHGGKTARIKAVLRNKGIKEKDFLDFSANLNPLGTPAAILKAMQESITYTSNVYPDPEYPEERAILAAFEGVKPENILLTNGGAEAIFLAARLFKNGKAGIFQPTFSEYERACLSNDIEVTYLSYEELKTASGRFNSDVLFLCRPNNPTGEIISKKAVVKLLDYACLNDQAVIIDEAFIHFTERDESLEGLLQHYSNLIIIRSLTKIFAVPGIRSGYLLASHSIIKKLDGMSVPWSVNCAALGMIHALPHTYDHLAETKNWLQAEWQHLKTELQALTFSVSDSMANFYLLNDPLLENHEPLLLFLANEGILARHTMNFHGIEGSSIRLAIRTREENEKLLTALRKWRKHS
ncbi:pyridoxal phosphate-dependent class II aminotransferase [Metabacillus idriensis]|uniref:pyridoxal phosphate-dependent aminotransferase n=1 Tax=Metabacillus idriensis TaxID=324768 RepID=UPI0028130C06|nr:pyridoxal phosphate-dependent class II aminotransferase [Metabacillus idriensis]MDR0137515.1 pyridoxal phosphate-dependent class II aminotransferase [Metabacillus idriensis]